MISKAIEDIVSERRRQLEVEGWTFEHDDQYKKMELSKAAACYAVGSQTIGWSIPGDREDFVAAWPWESKWWKPKTRRENLVRAGALIVAEIERIDRGIEKK